ncbi:ABC transporter ATP-binding protein [Brytella acorum]|uniref:ABC transporter ATP-binding protein n=1 Tax=Brytella acorum TaxID=2959299 RepID=A0AA35UYI5_9PROT|nr:ABC transporter ATP-binding protein [Brytella acorum]MDF3623782.1 ABC transporter ATP-binding protein [Brytella acorum]CAI9121810.1 ABC transporter ATP-binding protein [Brytella acorum]
MAAAPLLQLSSLMIANRGPDVSLLVRRGEHVALFGDDGAYLSRLLDVISGHATPLLGRVTMDGSDVTAMPAERRRIGLLGSRDPLFSHMTVHENVAFPLRVRRASRSEVAAMSQRMLAMVRMEAAALKKPAQLSVEEAFRARLARLLAYAPDLLLFDDPLHALDAGGRRRVAALIGTLTRALDLTSISTTCERGEALLLGSRIAVMEGGRVLQCDRADILLDRPTAAGVAVRFGEANRLTGHVVDIQDDIARIRLSAGADVEAVGSETLEANSPCVVCIRPDRIAPHFGTAFVADPDEDVPLTATLQDIIHMGDHIRMRVRLADGTDMELRRPPMQNLRALSQGARLQLAWPAAQAVAFPLD